MSNKDFNIICLNFQQKIINVFNEEQKIPFLMKFFLFKQIWKIIKKQKIQNEIEARSSKTEEVQSITTSIPIENLKNLQKKEQQE